MVVSSTGCATTLQRGNAASLPGARSSKSCQPVACQANAMPQRQLYVGVCTRSSAHDCSFQHPSAPQVCAIMHIELPSRSAAAAKRLSVVCRILPCYAAMSQAPAAHLATRTSSQVRGTDSAGIRGSRRGQQQLPRSCQGAEEPRLPPRGSGIRGVPHVRPAAGQTGCRWKAARCTCAYATSSAGCLYFSVCDPTTAAGLKPPCCDSPRASTG